MLIVWVSFNYNSDSLLRLINSNVYIRWIFDKDKHDFKSAIGLGSCLSCWTFEVVVYFLPGLGADLCYIFVMFFTF